MATHSELLSQELVGDLLFLVCRPAAEVGEQLLPVRFVFGLQNNKTNDKRCYLFSDN